MVRSTSATEAQEPGTENAMVTVECPWCDKPAVVEMMADDERLRCDDCAIVADLAPEVQVLALAA
jgi:hypothetical protein